jgi:GT2 family glycosyltransferase
VQFAIVDVDLDGPIARVHRPAGAHDGALLIGRRDRVPIGSCFHVGPLDPDDQAVAALLERRPDEPPGPVDVPLSITVAVCTKDRPDLLARCLDAIARSIAAAGDEVVAEMLVIDNASGDERTRDTALAAGSRCVREEVPGLDVARNAAVAAATGAVLAFVDDDVVVDELWVRTLARAFAAHPEAVAVTGHIRAYRLDTDAQIEFERTGGFAMGWEPLSLDRTVRGDVPFGPNLGVGCNMAFRRDLFARIGQFDDALDTGRPLPGGGDLDILIRAALAGPIWYEPSALVFHEHRRDFEALRYQFYSWGKSWAVVLFKWYRLAPEHRVQLRWSARRTLRRYGRDLLLGPRGKGIHRREDAAAMILGFCVASLGAYGRSQRRMANRRVRAYARVAGTSGS